MLKMNGQLAGILIILMLNVLGVNGSWADSGGGKANPPLSESDAVAKARAYYDSRGEWAGKFTITKVRQVRFEQQSPTSLVAHIQYQAAFLQDMSKTVEDQRTFGFSFRDGSWHADWMGGHKSASF